MISIRGREQLPLQEQLYVFPNDVTETQRLNLQHANLKKSLGGNALAPIATPQRILDIGCGTGIWCIEMAEAFPDAEVIGIDLVAPRTPSAILKRSLPANYRFQEGNILIGTSFPGEYFDYVHMRTISPGIPAARWEAVFQELARVTAPQGWVESIEVTMPEQCGPILQQIFTIMRDAITPNGIDLAINASLEQYMRNAGLTTTSTRAVVLPLGVSGNEIGRFMGNDYITGIIGFGEYLVQQQIVDATTFDTMVQGALRELLDERYHAISPFYISIGQKAAR